MRMCLAKLQLVSFVVVPALSAPDSLQSSGRTHDKHDQKSKKKKTWEDGWMEHRN